LARNKPDRAADREHVLNNGSNIEVCWKGNSSAKRMPD
jgi:hypothetical protein